MKTCGCQTRASRAGSGSPQRGHPGPSDCSSLGPFRGQHPSSHAALNDVTPGDSRVRIPGDTPRFSGLQFFDRFQCSPIFHFGAVPTVWRSRRSSGDNFFGHKVRAWFEVRVKFDSTNTLSMFGFPNKLFEFSVRFPKFNFGIGSGDALKRAPQK